MKHTNLATEENEAYTIMRHRRKGRKLGRIPSHQRALLRSLATALILTERDAEDEENKPKVKGRIITTIQKAKEVRPLVERVVTIAIRALPQIEAAARLEPEGERNSEDWKNWRQGPGLGRVEQDDRPGAGGPAADDATLGQQAGRADSLQ